MSVSVSVVGCRQTHCTSVHPTNHSKHHQSLHLPSYQRCVIFFHTEQARNGWLAGRSISAFKQARQATHEGYTDAYMSGWMDG
mmetsp:Transcript_27210/g.67888  ORF Transcript_27210/g.67888 Transcript_27210/m.67888 type:complete len:83 (+) Transcript_27210:536-784(+)